MRTRSLKPLRSIIRFMVWRESVAPDCEAWCCYGEVVRNGWLYAGGTMLLAEPRNYRAQGDVVVKFVEEASTGRMAIPTRDTYRGIPFAGFLRDLRR